MTLAAGNVQVATPTPRGTTENQKMAAERPQNLQDTFLNYVRKQKIPLTILLRRDGHSQLVYKHAISTIMPGAQLQMFEPVDEPEKA
jgi:host factor-I protein